MIIIADMPGGTRFGLIVRAGIVVRAPLPMLLGASLASLAEWALYEGVILTPLAIAECVQRSSGVGFHDVADSFRWPKLCESPSKTPGKI